MPASFPIRRLARSLIRLLRLKRKARVLDVGCGSGDLVGILRRARIEAYGLFDGPATPLGEDAMDIPDLQPATLHQSIPFLAQSFDAVVVRASSDYDGSLATPEACTATANLLAALKPGGRLVYCGDADFGRMQQHLSRFPGQGKHMLLGNSGFFSMLQRLVGLAGPGLPVLLFAVPAEAISRLEWHRIAREAVASLNQPAVAEDDATADLAAESPAA